MRQGHLLHQNTSASSTPRPLPLQSSPSTSLASSRSYQFLWHLILPFFCVFSASWCFIGCLDNLCVLLCLFPSWNVLGGTMECLELLLHRLQCRSLLPRWQRAAATQHWPGHSTLQVGTRLLPASTDHLPPLLLLPYCCTPYSHLQQPFSQSSLQQLQALFLSHHHAPSSEEGHLTKGVSVDASGVWASMCASNLSTICHSHCGKAGHTNPCTDQHSDTKNSPSS